MSKTKLSPECTLNQTITEHTVIASHPSNYGAENVLSMDDSKYWLAENGKTEGQGFTVSLGSCNIMVSGVFIKNTHHGEHGTRATKSFRVLGRESGDVGTWQNLIEESLENPLLQGASPPIVHLISFHTHVKVQFLRFELLDYWTKGSEETLKGGGLAYFSAYLTAGKNIDKKILINLIFCRYWVSGGLTSWNWLRR